MLIDLSADWKMEAFHQIIRREIGGSRAKTGMRIYDATLNRFLQPDTDVPASQGPQALNRYAYVLNNPVKYTDPTGHESKDPCDYYGECVGTLFGGVDFNGVEFVMNNMNSSADSLITAAGIAVQSQYYNPIWDNPLNPLSSSYGPAQLGQGEYGAGENPLDMNVAIKGMENRIKSSQALCDKGCSSTDLIIIAALAQNGPGGIFNPKDVVRTNGQINWEIMFSNRNYKPWWTPDGIREKLAGGLQYDSRLMLRLYVNDMRALMLRGWKLPPEYKNINWRRLEQLASAPPNVAQPQ